MQGPCLLKDLTQVLLRFRRYEHALIADVAKMFLMIVLDPKDRPYHRFLWERDGRPIIYQSNSHMFGNTGSPSVATY